MSALSAALAPVTFQAGPYLEHVLEEAAAGVGDRKSEEQAKAEFFREVGGRIRAAREAKGWNRERLAQEMGLGFGSISNYERGEVALDRVDELASVLGVDARWLLHGDRRLLEALEQVQVSVAGLVEADVSRRLELLEAAVGTLAENQSRLLDHLEELARRGAPRSGARSAARQPNHA